VPYSSIGRLILLYLQTEVIRTGDLEVELGKSMHAWLSRMGIPAGGKNYKLVAKQAGRIPACRLPFLTEMSGADLRQDGAFVQNPITLTTAADERHPPQPDKPCELAIANRVSRYLTSIQEGFMEISERLEVGRVDVRLSRKIKEAVRSLQRIEARDVVTQRRLAEGPINCAETHPARRPHYHAGTDPHSKLAVHTGNPPGALCECIPGRCRRRNPGS
jgi:hypothetical protein